MRKRRRRRKRRERIVRFGRVDFVVESGREGGKEEEENVMTEGTSEKEEGEDSQNGRDSFLSDITVYTNRSNGCDAIYK